jgi:predicted GH43/DUF377 family glycosyl hydrolase
MTELERLKENPILLPNKDREWEAAGSFNPCAVKFDHKTVVLYRAQSAPKSHQGVHMSLSTIGLADSEDGIDFNNQRKFIEPVERWERFGCEDPRVTFLDGKYYIFYTALSDYPFSPSGIKVGVAITKDFKTIDAKHPVTNFNSKAMALFPEKIDGKIVGILTANTDHPPAKIALAVFEKEEDIWSESYWSTWYKNLDSHVIPLLRNENDHLEVGAPPIKTSKGWLLIYSYIQNYFSSKKIFGVEAVLLDLKDPSKVIGRINEPLMVPEKEYELYGDVPNIIFPSGAILEDGKVYIYYGAADTTSCVAIGNLQELLVELTCEEDGTCIESEHITQGFRRYERNPILSPRPEFNWEAKAVFNPAAVYEGGKFHIVYRAMSRDNTSVFGYASSRDGLHIDERLRVPIYVPRAGFESKSHPGNSGCEDPRITKMGDLFYMFYTAYDGYTPRVAYTTIKVEDFLNKKWNWSDPKVITPPGVDDKDACLFPKKINGKFVVFHRADNCICINFEDDLDFHENKWLVNKGCLIKPRKDYWDNRKFGIAAPPLETPHGWLMFYHRVSVPGDIYKVEAGLLALNDPTKVIAKTDASLLEPELDYEKIGQVPNVVFPCGAVLLNDMVYLYYGGGDRVVGVAKMELKDILKRLGM